MSRFCSLSLLFAVALAGPVRAEDYTDVRLGWLNQMTHRSASDRVGDFPTGTVGLTMATTSCNIGTVDVPWWSINGDGDNSPKWECPRDPRDVPNSMSGCHPSIGMEMYRLRDGRLDQIGISWLKHGWYALCSTQCDDCPVCPPGGNHLGVGCSDTYGTGHNADQSNLGPRSEWNPYTNHWEPCGSHFDGPNNDCKSSSHSHGPIDHRVRVADADLNVPDAEFFYQAVYYVEHEALLWDNIGWQPIDEVRWSGTKWVFDLSHPRSPTWQPIIQMWDPDAVELDTGEGLAYAGVQVTQIDEDTWHYEYAVYNYTSNIPLWSFAVPLAAEVEVTDAGFHDVDDPEEPWSLDDWTLTQADGMLTWAGEPYDVNANANALRFGRQYTFWFTVDVPPVPGRATLGLFLPGSPEEIHANLEVPLADSTPPKIVGSIPHAGYLDPRMESSDGVNLDMGITEIMLFFSEGVQNLDGSSLSADAFTIRETGGGEGPQILGIDTDDDMVVTVFWDRPITLQEWTTIEANVEDFAGNDILDLGDMQEIDEGDRVDIAFMPVDVTQNGLSQPQDLSRWIQMYTGEVEPPKGEPELFIDTNRDGLIQPWDLSKFIQLLNGTGVATRVWLGEQMNNTRP
ncbi:MAG: hypothetical protein IID05_12500 [Gemmatimonadetes bacterium]|nr:hypothetical protein [Gemmatimonadota bacterium]